MSRPRSRLTMVAGLGAVALVAWLWLRPGSTPVRPDDDPRISFPTPLRNVRPEVQYVGDAVCARCHGDVAAAYARHPMSRSVAPVGQMQAVEHYGLEARN